MNTFKERLIHLMEVDNYVPNSLASDLKTSAVNIYGYLNGRAEEPSDKMLKKFEAIGYSRKWLTTGIGEMKIEKQEVVKKAPIIENNSTSTSDYLLETIKRIEDSFKTDLMEKDRIIQDQRFIIDSLKSQIQGNFLEPIIEKTEVAQLYSCMAA